MRHTRKCLIAALAAACTSAEGPPPRLAGEAPRRVVATFTGEVDLAAGTFEVTALAAAPGQGLTELPVVRDGVPGVGPDDTVELVTEGYTMRVTDGCAPGVDAFEGIVRLRSFYVSACLRNAYAEIVQMAPATGHEGCTSAPAVPGTSDALGLFSYGVLAKKGRAGDSATAAWRFRLGDATQFTFRGRILADVTPECASPGLPGVPAVALADAPGGLAADDLDGDALPELATVAGRSGEAVLVVAGGAGGGRFAAPAETALGAGLAAPRRTVLANVRGSAAPDLLYTDGSGNLVVRERLAGGAWGAPTAHAAAGADALATADLDGDGDLDVVVAGTGLTVFLNAGGALTPLAIGGATSSGRAVLAADLDNDGISGLITVAGPSAVLVPQKTAGGFGFTAAEIETVPLAGAELRDVAVVPAWPLARGWAANFGNRCLARFRSNRPGRAFIYEACLPVPFAPERIAAADLDGNGVADLAVAADGVLAVLLDDATQPDGFRWAIHGGVPAPTQLLVRDVDGDGRPDLLVTSAAARAHAVFLNAGGGAFAAPARVAAGAGADALAAVDLNGDGLPDLAVANPTAASVTPVVAAGVVPSAGAPVAVPSAPVAIAGGDVTGDGRPDVAVALAGSQVCVLAGTGTGGLLAPACAATDAAPSGLALLDLTGDGALDAAVPLDDGRVLGFRNVGGALVRDAALDGTAVAGAAGAVAADVTGDGRADLVVAGDALAVLPNTGAGLGPALLAAHGVGGRALALGDLDGDRVLDAVTTGPDALRVFLGDGAGGFSFAAAVPFPAPAGVALADVDGDGALDLAASSSDLGLVGVVANATPASGLVTFAAPVWWPAGAAGAGIVAADLDGDGRVDLAAADAAGGAVDVLRAACLP